MRRALSLFWTLWFWVLLSSIPLAGSARSDARPQERPTGTIACVREDRRVHLIVLGTSRDNSIYKPTAEGASPIRLAPFDSLLDRITQLRWLPDSSSFVFTGVEAATSGEAVNLYRFDFATIRLRWPGISGHVSFTVRLCANDSRRGISKKGEVRK